MYHWSEHAFSVPLDLKWTPPWVKSQARPLIFYTPVNIHISQVSAPCSRAITSDIGRGVFQGYIVILEELSTIQDNPQNVEGANTQ